MKIVKTGLKLLTLCLFATAAGNAEAGSIQNLTDTPKTVEVKYESGGDSYKTITIDSWDKYSYPGLMRVRFAGNESTIQPDGHFAIWSDTTMGPQRKSGNLQN